MTQGQIPGLAERISRATPHRADLEIRRLTCGW